MCRFFSGIITKNKTIYGLDQDSHEFLIEKAGLKDKTNSPDFVRVELLPQDNDIFNHDLKNWKIKVDQDFKPDWFSEKFAETEMKKALKILISERFIINEKDWQERKDQRIFVKQSRVKAFKCSVEAWENSSVEAWENSSVEARENSSVEARENSSVEARGNSSVEARENSSVEAWGNSSVEARENSSVVAWGNSSVVAWENSSVVARGNSSVVAWENSSVVAWENSSVVAWGNSSVEARENSSVVARGNSSVVARGNSSVILPTGWWEQNTKIKGIYDLASVKDLRVNKIFVADKKLEIEIFKK